LHELLGGTLTLAQLGIGSVGIAFDLAMGHVNENMGLLRADFRKLSIRSWMLITVSGFHFL
jgi:hypothetical protein